MSRALRRRQDRQRAACDREDEARIHGLIYGSEDENGQWVPGYLEGCRAELAELLRIEPSLTREQRARLDALWRVRLARAEVWARAQLERPLGLGALVGDVPMELARVAHELAAVPDWTPQRKGREHAAAS